MKKEFIGASTQILSFLKCVMVDNGHSDKVLIESEMPQVTVLGTLLFLLYINDLPDNIKSCVRLFTDGCLLYRPIKALVYQTYLWQDLHALTQWAKTWGIKVNPSECHIMSKCQSTNIEPYLLYSLCGCVLSSHKRQVSRCDYLQEPSVVHT